MKHGGARNDIGPLSRLLGPDAPSAPAALGFGAWAAGGAGWGPDADAAAREGAVRRARELGVVFFDTAPAYGAGESERLLGRVLGAERDAVCLATKVGPRDDPRTSLEASLRRLGTEVVDLVQLHETLEGWEGRLETLFALAAEGKARAVGICNASARQLTRALALGPVVTAQLGYNLFDRDVEARVLPLCRERAVRFLAYRPLAAGLLTGKYREPPAFAAGDHRAGLYWFKGEEFARRGQVLDALTPLAARCGRTVAALAIGWLRGRSGVSVVLVGARTAAQVDDNFAAAAPLEPELAAEVDAAVARVFAPARATPALRAAAADWGPRERFIVDRLDGRTPYEAIAAEWSDREEGLMIAAQIKVFVDQLVTARLLERAG